jgi:protein involved in polysaccharide export with SLBB domain
VIRFYRLIALILVVQMALGPVGMGWAQARAKKGGGGDGAPAKGQASPKSADGGRMGVSSASPAEEQLPGGQALSRAVSPEEYLLGPGDGLTITIWGEYDDKYDVRISPDGKISIPTIGTLVLKDVSLAKAEALIGVEVKRYYRNVKSSVTLTSLRVFEVLLVGEVRRPGSYLATPVRRVSDIIAQAGGVLGGGSQRYIKVLRDGKEVGIADLVLFHRQGSESVNPYLRDGDVILVPPMSGHRVSVFAAQISTEAVESGGTPVVENSIPYTVEIKEGERLTSVISELGGVSPWWNLESVFIQRESQYPEGTMRIPADLQRYYLEQDESLNPILKAGDQVYISAMIRRVFVTGAVKIPAVYTYVPGKSADTYIAQAGGASLVADFDRSFIKRADGTIDPYMGSAEIDNGDTIVVLEKVIKTWQDYFTLVGAVSGVIVGLVSFYAVFTNFGR